MIRDQFDVLYEEASRTGSGRVMCVSLPPVSRWSAQQACPAGRRARTYSRPRRRVVCHGPGDRRLVPGTSLRRCSGVTRRPRSIGMSSTDPYLEYPLRKLGYDQPFYEWETLPDRPMPEWPEGNGLAAIVVVPLQTFRFDAPPAPYRPSGAPSKEYPDYREWSSKDYGSARWRIPRLRRARRTRHQGHGRDRCRDNAAVSAPRAGSTRSRL